MVQPLYNKAGLTSPALDKENALMRRIFMVATLALMLAAMMLVMAVPAFASGAPDPCKNSTDTTIVCSGGGSREIGGEGGHATTDKNSGASTISGGGGGGGRDIGGGGGGGYCTKADSDHAYTCNNGSQPV
jgi:hypothetical protein